MPIPNPNPQSVLYDPQQREDAPEWPRTDSSPHMSGGAADRVTFCWLDLGSWSSQTS